MYIPNLTALVPFFSLVWLAQPKESTITNILSYLGIASHEYKYNLIALAVFAGLSCLIDEAYRQGPNELVRKLKKALDIENNSTETIDVTDSASASSASTASSSSSTMLAGKMNISQTTRGTPVYSTA